MANAPVDLSELQRRALALRNEVMRGIEAENAERNAARARNLEAAVAGLERAAAELRAAQAESAEARRRALNGARAARPPKPLKTRKHNPGANYEVSGRPAHLAPGAPLRKVEGRRSHSRSLATTRGRRSKAKY